MFKGKANLLLTNFILIIAALSTTAAVSSRQDSKDVRTVTSNSASTFSTSGLKLPFSSAQSAATRRSAVACDVLKPSISILQRSGAAQAAYTVTNTSNTGPGSLRAAIDQANTTIDDDIINFSIPSTDLGCSASGVCTIALTTGELAINAVSTAGRLSIVNASGADKLIVSGGNASRVFLLQPNSEATLDGVTVANGNAGAESASCADCGYGGGIRVAQFGSSVTRLTIKNSVIRNNFAANGGGIYTYGFNKITITNSTIDGNTFTGGGGGISNTNGALTLINSTVSNNSGQLTSTGRGGAGIYNSSGGVLEIANSTISGNTVAQADDGGSVLTGNGGGIYNAFGNNVMTVTNSTIANNTAKRGGGVYVDPNGFTDTYLRNDIIAANTGTIGQADLFEGTSFELRSRGNNLIGNAADTGAGTISWQSSDLLNQSPLLAPLGNYGGATRTHALLSGSPAIDHGNNCVLTATGCGTNNPPAALPTDQRGAARVGNVDIGAFEFNTTGTNRTVLDFNGDGKTDFVIARSADRNSPSTWWISDGGAFQEVVQFGIGTTGINTSSATADRAAPADYDGDGKTDIAVWRPNANGDGRGVFYILRSSDAAVQIAQFGRQGDDPTVSGDYDGDGKADPAVFRKGAALTSFDPCGGGAVWYYRPSSAAGVDFRYICWGAGGDTDFPAPGDYDGDGKMDFAVLRNSNGQGMFYLNKSGGGTEIFPYGLGTDQLNPGDYDGDGKTDLCLARYDTVNPNNRPERAAARARVRSFSGFRRILPSRAITTATAEPILPSGARATEIFTCGDRPTALCKSSNGERREIIRSVITIRTDGHGRKIECDFRQ